MAAQTATALTWALLVAAAGIAVPAAARDTAPSVVPTPPGAPQRVVAIAGDQSATIYWSAPVSDGGSPITGFNVTSSPDGKTAAATASATSARVSSLTNATSYTFTVTATNTIGTGPPSTPSNPIVPGRGGYQTLTPARILDTRDGPSPLGPGETRNIQVAGRGGVPSTGVGAAVINVTVTNTTAWSHLTLYPAGVPRPLASNLNWLPGQTVPNLAEIALGADGQIAAYNAAGTVDVIFDVAGYVLTPNAGAPAGSLLEPMVPVRVLDTRQAGGQVGPGQSIRVLVAGLSYPHTAAVLNVTATNPTAASYLTVWPDGESQPTASNLNFVAGQTVANRVQVKISLDGYIRIYNAGGWVDVVADLNGRFVPGIPYPSGGSLFVGETPARIADTRSTARPLGAGITMSVQVTGVADIPPDATAVVVNVTVTNTTAASYLTVYPPGAEQPRSSDLNWVPGDTRPNLAVVKIGPTGDIYIYNAGGTTDVIVDVVGWYG